MSQSAGRPRLENPKNERLYIRVTIAEKAEIMEFSKQNSVSLLELIKKGMESIKE